MNSRKTEHWINVFRILVGVDEGVERMTDEEVICAWMKVGHTERVWIPQALTLVALHEVEATLSTPGQWWEYYTALCAVTGEAVSVAFRHLIHASAEQKIKALAQVLRQTVTK